MIFREADKNPQLRYLYLVPEQATLQVQRELIEAHPRHVIGNIEVVSFTSLARDVMEELEIPMTNLLDDVGKSMILRRLAEEMKQELPAFGRNLAGRGFIEELKRVINELAMCGVRTDRMEQVLLTLQGSHMLKRKMEDIYRLYLEFSRQLGESYMTAEELLWVLTKHVQESKRLRSSHIIVYGFTSFKQYQYQVLEQLMISCPGMILAVTMGDDLQSDLFPMAESTCRSFSAMAKAHGLTCRQASFAGLKVLPVSEEIRHLERHLFRYPAVLWEAGTQNLRLIRAKNPAQEVSYVLREMLRLVREEGYRYSDMAVITGDLSVYGSTVTAALTKAGVPYFLDEKKKLENNPLAELIEEVLDVLEENMSYPSVMALLRNPLFPMDRERVDILDNYLVASGVEGKKRWNEMWPWLYGNISSERLNEINGLRVEVCEKLSALQEIWKGERRLADGSGKLTRGRMVVVREGIEALVRFLQDINAQAGMERWMERFEEQGDFVRQSEYRQAYQKVMDLFDQIVQLMGEEELKPQVLIDTLHSGFEGLKVGFIPVTFDRVVVGDLVRTRLTPVKALFLIGANDKVLPKESVPGGILNDYDREALKEAGMELLPTAREEAFFQQEYLYLMMTNATKQLIVTFSEQNREGKEIRPSYLIGELKRIFPSAVLLRAEDQFPGLDGLIGAEDGLELLISGLRAYLDGEEPQWWRPLYRHYLDQEEFQECLEQVMDALFYSWKTEKLDREIAGALFDIRKENHVTRLEQYAGCAYAHFLTYGLKLAPRRRHELQAADYGTVFHRAVSGFFHRLKEERLDWRKLTGTERARMAAECVEAALQASGNPVFESSARSRYAKQRITRMTDRTLWALGEQWKEGSYQRFYDEYVFSESYGNAIHLPLKDGLTLALQGRIDRIDISETDDSVYVKIIDYKSGQLPFDLGRVYHGLQLQLLLYLEAVMEMEKRRYPDKRIVPAGIYYYHMKDPLVSAMGQDPGAQDQERLKELRMDGLTNSDMEAVERIDPRGGAVVKGLERKKDGGLKATASAASSVQFQMLQKHARKKAGQLADAMYAGEISASPSEYGGRSACDWCEYQSICAFELRTEGCCFRRLEKLSKDEIWQEIDEEERQVNERSGKEEEDDGSGMDQGTAAGH